jgi:hypothetical protein
VIPAGSKEKETTMITNPSRRETHLQTTAEPFATRLRRITAVLAAVISGLLASVAIVPAAFAMVPDPGGAGAGNQVAPTPPPTVVTVGGMAGWQITLIALGAALAAATVAVLLDRALAARRTTSTTA